MDEYLRRKFAAMSDEEMVSLGHQYASLTDDAQALVREEFKRRSLEGSVAKNRHGRGRPGVAVPSERQAG